jgi:aspartate 1-decarboxylase
MDLVDIAEYEKVLVVSNTSGARLETYVITGEADS